MKPITPAQLKIIHVLLKDSGVIGSKADLVYSFTDGRTESSREMTIIEAKELIDYLKRNDKRDEIIRRIWHLAYELKIIVPGDRTEKAINAAALDRFCLQRGTIKKKITAQSVTELGKTLRQFEAMHSKYEAKKGIEERIRTLRSIQAEYVEKEMYKEAGEIQMEIETIFIHTNYHA